MIQRQDQIAFIGGGGSVRRKYVMLWGNKTVSGTIA